MSMQRFTAATLAFLLLPVSAVQLLTCHPVAAQELQQSQSSDTGQGAAAKPASTAQPQKPDTAQPTVSNAPTSTESQAAGNGQASAKAPAVVQPEGSETVQPSAVKPTSLRIPDGTPIEVEAPYTFRSMDFKPQDRISFRVVNPIKIDGVTLVEQGANATGRVERSKRGGHWGKAGLLVWTMVSVTAVDGSQIPVRPTSVRLRGDSKGAKVATQIIVMGALMPLIAPVALLAGFKRGKDAFIPEGKRYSIFVDGDASVKPGPAASDK